MGQPSRGDSDIVATLTVDNLNAYKGTNYFGDNLVVVGSGAVDHQAFVDQVNEAFATMGKTATGEKANTDKAVYVPALMFVRDDEMANSNVSVFYDAPSIKHPDYYGFLMLKHMMGNYRIDKVAAHLNDTRK